MNENDLKPESENEVLPPSSDETVDDAPDAIVDERTLNDSPDVVVEADVAEVVIVETETLSVEADDAPYTPQGDTDDWLIGDIDAALAAVASLNELVPEREVEAEVRADAAQSTPTFVPEMQLPPLMTLKRGQLGSLVPALLLIGIGAWLTLTTTTGAAIDGTLLAVVSVGGIVLTLLAEWLGTGRWSRGVFFVALLLLLIAGVVVFSVQPNGINLVQGYPLLVAALGLAVVIVGVLARPVSARLIAPGVLLIVAGSAGLLVTLGLIPADILAFAAPLLPVVLVVVVVILLLPLVFRRRA